MRKVLTCLGIVLACILPAQAQISLTSSGSVQFSPLVLSGVNTVLSAGQAPAYIIQWQNQVQGFSLVFSAPVPTSETGKTLPSVIFTARNGSFTDFTTGAPPGVTVESQFQGSLSGSVQALSVAPGSLNGIYRYIPYAPNFQVSIPAESYQGSYRADLTATLMPGI
ncbi:hypothetical protein JST97_13595 [bacterium]|nr:hypothetical protein [bacterium]